MSKFRFICPNTEFPCDFKYCDSPRHCLFEECKTISDINKGIAAAFTDKNANIFRSYSYSREQEYWNFLLTPPVHVIHFGEKVLINVPKNVTNPSSPLF